MDAFARYYDVDAGLETEDLPFYLAIARRTGGPVLEVGCGTGRVLVPLARAGFDVVGVDVSPAMLALAAQRVAAAGPQSKVSLVRADARRLDLVERFNLAFVALNSLMHFVGDGDPEDALSAIHRHLRPTGLLVLALPNPEATLLGESSGQLVHEWTRTAPDTGHQLLKLRSQTIDSARQVLRLTFVYDDVAPDGTLRRTAIPFELRYFFPRELRLLLEKSRFAIEDFYGGYELEPFESDSEHMVVVARPVPV